MTDPAAFGLGRVRREDPRDRDFLMERKIEEVAPVGAALHQIPHLYNQGQTPRCVGYSCAGVMSGLRYAELGSVEVDYDADSIYAWANAHDGDLTPHDGSTVRAGLTALVSAGSSVLYSQAPVDPVGSVQTLTNYLWADTAAPGADVDRLITWLLTIGPVVVGIDWYNDMFTPGPDGFVHLTGGAAGGHAIMIRGVNANDPNNTYFVLRNSWGFWGVRVHDDWTVDTKSAWGDALISKADLVSLLSNGGEAGAPVDNLSPVTPSPAPAPPPVNPVSVAIQDAATRIQEGVNALTAALKQG